MKIMRNVQYVMNRSAIKLAIKLVFYTGNATAKKWRNTRTWAVYTEIPSMKII